MTLNKRCRHKRLIDDSDVDPVFVLVKLKRKDPSNLKLVELVAAIKAHIANAVGFMGSLLAA